MPKRAKPTSKRSLVSRLSKLESKRKPTAKAKQASRKPKATTVHENGEWTIVRNEAYQREFSILKDGKPAIPSVRFATALEALRVLKAVTGEAFKPKDEEPKQVPNRPEFHESVQAVRGQTPRA